MCSRCTWLSNCHGCLIPDNDLALSGQITDDETIAVDWHFIVNEEFIDVGLASEIKKHPSVDIEAEISKKQIIPFKKCVEKFIEEEKIEGITCPRCVDDSRMM